MMMQRRTKRGMCTTRWVSLHLACRAERGPGNPGGYGLRTRRVRRPGIRSPVVPGRARRACDPRTTHSGWSQSAL